MGKTRNQALVLKSPSVFEKFLLLLLLLLLPSQLGRHFWPTWTFVNGVRVDYLSPTLYINDILIWLLLVPWLARGQLAAGLALIGKKTRLALALITSLLVLNFVFSQNHLITIYRFFRLFEYSFLFLYLRANLRHFAGSTISSQLSLTVIWASLLGLFQFIYQHSLGGLAYWLGERSFTASTPGVALGLYPRFWDLRLRPYSSFSHPNSLAGFLLVCLILIWPGKDRIIKTAKILGSITLVLTLSFLPIAIGLSLVLASTLQKKSQLIRLFTGLCASLFTIYYLLFTLHSRPASLPERLFLNRTALALIRQHPFTGVGLGNFIPASRRIQILNSQLAYQPVHNTYLLLISELGLPAFLLIAYIVMLNWKMIKGWELKLPLLAVIATGAVDHYWLTLPQNQLLFCLTIALVWYKSSGKAKMIKQSKQSKND